MPSRDYVRSVQEWRSSKDADLRKENGWLALAGLFWLEPGVNRLGSSPNCEIVLPKPAPPLLGALEYDGKDVILKLDTGQEVQLNGMPVHSAARLNTDVDDDASFITLNDLRMVVIKREGGVALRVWDNSRPQRRNSPPRKWFDIDPRYRVQGLYAAYPSPKKVALPNAFGEIETAYMEGYVSFKLDGQSHSLDATEVDDGQLYLQFADLTNGIQTYPSGRYLYTDRLQEDGQVVVDFNMAYSPPCAFTAYATCSFAPQGNHLQVAISAGELYAGGH